MRISDWSSDVCSSDLRLEGGEEFRPDGTIDGAVIDRQRAGHDGCHRQRTVLHDRTLLARADRQKDRKSVASGKSVSVRVDLGGRRIINKKTISTLSHTLPPIQKKTL